MINELFAYVFIEGEREQVLFLSSSPDEKPQPAVADSLARLSLHAERAREITREAGVGLKVARFVRVDEKAQ
jgi:hypothetical protein